MKKQRLMSTILNLAAVSLLSACSHSVSLYPRGAGEVGTGTLNDGTREIVIHLRGKTYTGKFVRNETYGVSVGQTLSVGNFGRLNSMQQGFGTSGSFGSSNQAAALLVSGSDVLRCDLVVVNASDGSGVCSDRDGQLYDVLIK